MTAILNELVLLLCLGLLFVTKSALTHALRRGDVRLARVLTFFRMGLALSAISYLLRLAMPASDFARVAGLLCTLGGTLLIWIGGLEHMHLRRERLGAEARADEEAVGEVTSPVGICLPPLTAHTQRVLRHAADEARRRRQDSVDTEHVLLGLLRECPSAGTDILGRLHIRPDHIRLMLGEGTGLATPPATPDMPLPLTERTRQALSLAAQEAHRFDRNAVGTDHLLLGLTLAGSGAAAIALFQEGVTVDGIRDEILRRPRLD